MTNPTTRPQGRLEMFLADLKKERLRTEVILYLWTVIVAIGIGTFVRNSNFSPDEMFFSQEEVSVAAPNTGGPDEPVYHQAPPGYFMSPLAHVHITQGVHGRERNSVDLRAEEGTNCHATLSGWVKETGYIPERHGNYIILSHGRGIESMYCHLSVIYVNKGDPVSQGQVIGLTGNTGNTTGPHLHFGVSGIRNPFL